MRACALGVVLWRRLPRLSCSYAGCCPRLLLLLPALVTRKWALRSLCAAQSRATREAAAVSGAPGPTPTPQSATDPDHHLLRVRLSSNWLILVFNAVGKLQF